MEKNKDIDPQFGFTRLAQAREIGRSAIEIAAEEAMTWDVFRWTVVILLLLNLSLSLFGGGSQAVVQDANDQKNALAALRTELNDQLVKTKAEMEASLVAAQFGLRQPPSHTKSEPTRSVEVPPAIPMAAKSPRRP